MLKRQASHCEKEDGKGVMVVETSLMKLCLTWLPPGLNSKAEWYNWSGTVLQIVRCVRTNRKASSVNRFNSDGAVSGFINRLTGRQSDQIHPTTRTTIDSSFLIALIAVETQPSNDIASNQ